MPTTSQADNQIHEDQLLKFLVNVLTEAFSVELGENAEIDPEDTLEFDVKAVYLDSGFYDGKCLTLLQAHNFAYVLPIIRWGSPIKAELNQGWSREITE